MNDYDFCCPYCGKDLLDEQRECCGEYGHAVRKGSADDPWRDETPDAAPSEMPAAVGADTAALLETGNETKG